MKSEPYQSLQPMMMMGMGDQFADVFEAAKLAGVELDRKVLSDMAIHDPEGFTRLAEVARGQVN